MKAKNPRLEQMKGNNWIIYKVRSQSEPGRFHIAGVRYEAKPTGNYNEPFEVVFEPQEYVCSCDGFQFNGKCWHINALKNNHNH